jgi:CDP-diacylglycerol--serine O-phosphatidyltransferase
MHSKLLGFYNYTVILTYIGVMAGFLGITVTIDGDIWMGLVCLMMAGICDMFDGAVASTKKRNADEKCFGIQIDSLSDLLCFGVLPAVILCCANEGSEFSYAVSAFYVLGALIRLAYFNVDEQNRQQVSDAARKYYYGLPVTTIALILPLLFMICDIAGKKRGLVGTAALAGTAVLFLLPFRIKKPEITGKIVLGICGILEFAFLVAGLGDV